MRPAGRVDQLPGNARPLAGLPHRAFEDIARWAHHNPLPKEAADTQGAEIIMPDNGICERFNRTVLDEFYRADPGRSRDRDQTPQFIGLRMSLKPINL
jgi:hypothetical protein